jgi:hypothetical protein
MQEAFCSSIAHQLIPFNEVSNVEQNDFIPESAISSSSFRARRAFCAALLDLLEKNFIQ